MPSTRRDPRRRVMSVWLYGCNKVRTVQRIGLEPMHSRARITAPGSMCEGRLVARGACTAAP
jgi:hypothetical protein